MDKIAPVTVFLCVHNGEPWLRETLDAALAQDYPDFRILALENGSTDRSAEVLASYDDPRLDVRRLDRPGKPNALNYGLSQVETGYVCLLDQDDWLEPGSLSARADLLTARPELAMVHGSTICVAESGERWVEWWYEKDESWLTDLNNMLDQNFVNAGAAMWRREASPMFEEDRWPCEDYAMWLHFFANRQVGYTPQCVLRRRVHGKAVSSDHEMSVLMHRHVSELQAKYRRLAGGENS